MSKGGKDGKRTGNPVILEDIQVAFFEGNERNVTEYTNAIFDFEGLAERLCTDPPLQGGKYESYLVRGKIKDEGSRKDICIENARLIILDGDKTEDDEHSCIDP